MPRLTGLRGLGSANMSVRGKQRASVSWQEIWLPGAYKAHDFIKQAPPYLLPFAALMEGMQRPFIKELVGAIMQSSVPEQHKQDLLVVAAFFLARIFGMQDVFEEVQMSMLEPNPFVEFFEQRGLQKGLQEGREEGLQEGREEGLQKGREEAHRQMIHRMLERGMPVQVIADLIGLSVPEVERLAQKEPA